MEWKTRINGSIGQKAQLCAYAMLAENQLAKRTEKGFLMEGERGKIETVAIDFSLRQKTILARDEILKMMQCGLKPTTGASESQCCQCEYLNPPMYPF